MDIESVKSEYNVRLYKSQRFFILSKPFLGLSGFHGFHGFLQRPHPAAMLAKPPLIRCRNSLLTREARSLLVPSPIAETTCHLFKIWRPFPVRPPNLFTRVQISRLLRRAMNLLHAPHPGHDVRPAREPASSGGVAAVPAVVQNHAAFKVAYGLWEVIHLRRLAEKRSTF
jgi:hypothetical protein